MYKLLLSAVCLIATLNTPLFAATPYHPPGEESYDAQQGLSTILTLWRDASYDAVYDRTAFGGKLAKEHFVKRLAAATYRPACCWEQLQEVKIVSRDSSTVIVRGKIGLEGGGNTEYRTRSFKMVNEDGIWRLNQSEILSLAEGTKKRKAKRGSDHKKSAFTY